MSDRKIHNSHEILIDIITRFNTARLDSWPGLIVAISRSFESFTQRCEIKTGVLILTRQNGTQLVARHNLQQWDGDNLVGLVDDLQERIGELTWEASGIPKIWLLNDRTIEENLTPNHVVYRADVEREVSFWAILEPKDKPDSVDSLLFASYISCVARVIEVSRAIQRETRARQELEQQNTELKAAEASFVNIMEDLRRQNENLTRLISLGTRFACCSTLKELATLATKVTGELLGGSIVALFLRHNPQKDFKLSSIWGHKFDSQDFESFAIGIDELPEGDVEIIDTSSEFGHSEISRSLDLKTGMVVKLRGKTDVLGVLLVCEKRWPRVFAEDEIENMSALSNMLSIAIENLMLLEDTTRQLNQMSSLKEYVETVVDSVDLAILVVDNSFRITMFSKGFEKLYGYKPSDFIGRHLFEAFPHLLDQGFAEIIEMVKSGKPFVRNGWRRKNLDGTEVVQNIRILPHRDGEGRTIGGIAIISDVTEKAKLEDQLDRSEAKFRKLVEELDDGYIVVTNGTIVYANRSISELSGLPIHEVIGNKVGCLFPDSSMLEEKITPQARIRCESKLIHSSGTIVPVEVTIYPSDYGGEQALSVIIRDITERKNIEKKLFERNREMQLRHEQITRLNQELEATVNRLKQSQESLLQSEKMAMLSEIAVAANHEINQPLFSILGQAQLLLKQHTETDEPTYGRLKQIEEAALKIACVTKKITNLATSILGEEGQKLASPSDPGHPQELTEDLQVDSC